MVKDAAAVVAAAAPNRGIGYLGQMVRLFLSSLTISLFFHLLLTLLLCLI
jgi:hypothetical protein